MKIFKNSLKFFSSSKPRKPLFFKDTPLRERDPELFDIIEKEKSRQYYGLELIASENYTSKSVLECLGSILTNKYTEGYPGARYYGGTEHYDKIENLCIERAQKAFNLNADQWGVNVQPYSGSPANFAAYTALMPPGGKLMGLDLYCGGHLTHGFQTETKKISATALYFQSKSYKIDQTTGIINMDEVEQIAKEFKPNVLVVGASAYSRDYDYTRFRQIADSVGAYLMCDMAHVSGLIAAGELKNPFDYCDIITSTTHKSLRGPRAGLIFFNKGRHPDLEERVNFAVFPQLQGGPHNNQIAAICTQLLEVSSPEFKEYAQQVKRNAKAICDGLIKRGHSIVSGGTDNHLLLWDVRAIGLTGAKVEKALDQIHITVNKNTIIGDKSAMNPGGIRIGTPAVTSRGLREGDMDVIAGFCDRLTKVALDVSNKSGKKLKDFVQNLEGNTEIENLKKEVFEFSSQFDVPGLNVDEMKYLI